MTEPNGLILEDAHTNASMATVVQYQLAPIKTVDSIKLLKF